MIGGNDTLRLSASQLRLKIISLLPHLRGIVCETSQLFQDTSICFSPSKVDDNFKQAQGHLGSWQSISSFCLKAAPLQCS